jgi:hypothetical protein
MTSRNGSGKAWAAANLFEKRTEAGVKGPDTGGTESGGPAGFLRRLRPGEAWREGRVEIVPLSLEGDGSPAPVLLTREAVERGVLEIVERGQGVVQELLAWNKGDAPVAILEGDTLVGCKQNRVVAHSVIVAPGTSVVVPVGCMEHGRWHHESRTFSVGDVKMSPHVRRRTSAEVKAAALSGHRPALDQGRLWRDVACELEATGASSSTSDYYRVVEQDGERARERARGLPPRPGQVGALVLADGILVGLEASGHHGLWGRLSEPTLASYLMGMHRGGASLGGERASAADWLSRVQEAQVLARPGLGIGVDLDVRGRSLSGVGLALDSFTVHVAVFPA